MAVNKYSPEFLLFLRDSPLCKKPENLPPQEEWMGPPPEQQPRAALYPQSLRGHSAAFGVFEKTNPLVEQTNRRPDANRHASRNSATNPDDIVFGPPRISFTSSGRNRGFENDKPSRDGDPQGRFSNLRNRSGEMDGDRFRESRNANPLRRRGESAEQDSDDWSTVKPRKSFGADGSERFHGRMGGNFRDEKRPARERDDRPGRTFDTFSREADEDGRLRNNGLGRHKTEGSEGRVPEKRERIDRAKNWREREPEHDVPEDHGAGRYDNKRRGRDHRAEREPEWFDEHAEPKVEARTQQEFQKWMEEMKKSKGGQPSATQPVEPAVEAAKFSVRPPPAVEAGPDKFFMAFGSTSGMEAATPGEQADAPRPKPAGKSSRFTSFFQSQEGGKPEPPPPMAAPPPKPPSANGLAALLGSGPPSSGATHASDEDKQAFQQLLAKLQKQSVSATPPGPSPFAAPAPNNEPEGGRQNVGPSPFQYPQGEDRQGDPMARPPPQHVQEILAPRPQQQSARPEQLLQDLVGHHQRVSSQGSARGDAYPSRNNSNTEFLMNLMRAAPESQRSDSAMMRAAQQAQKQALMPQANEREGDFPQENRNAQRHMRAPPPPGFLMDDGFRGGEADFGQNRPTQILQRPPPPPGLEQMPPGWMGGQIPPPPHQQQQSLQQSQPPQHQRGPMPPPPGLAGGPGRNGPNGPMPHMFPPNMPPMPHPEAMGNMPPRNMGPPPPGFFNGPPHGFIPPAMGGFNGPPGPDSPFVGSPFEARGMPPSAGGRGANFGRG